MYGSLLHSYMNIKRINQATGRENIIAKAMQHYGLGVVSVSTYLRPTLSRDQRDVIILVYRGRQAHLL